MAQTRIKRISLNNSRRKGLYYRVYNPDSRKTSYYKVAGKRGIKSKAEALEAFRSRPRRLYLKIPKIEKEKGEQLEDVTLHFRVDYDSAGGGSRFHHQFLMKDSHITMKVPKSMTDDEAQEKLTEIFSDAFSEEFGSALSEFIEQDMISGLERGNGRSEGIRINYSHAKGRAFQTIEKSVGSAKQSRQEMDTFFQSIGREKR